MYRTVALYMLRNGIDPQDEQAVSACCGKADVRVAYRDGAQRTMLGEEDVTDLIRTGEVSAAASGISKWPGGSPPAWWPRSARSPRRRTC